jgi:ADP-ribose pyrophosphatase YjhB (NUDIX family)
MDYNSYKQILEVYFADGVEAYIPQVSINCVIFRYDHPTLKVLFHSLPGTDLWYLPGGYVRNEESLEEAAYRNLSYYGINEVFLRQTHTFGEVDRIPRLTESDFSDSSQISEIVEWVSKRFVTVVYYGLVNISNTDVPWGGPFKQVIWCDVDQLNSIGLDHANIAAETRKILSTELLNHPVASKLLQKNFTLNELRGLFESILDRPIDRGTFRRKMLQLGIIKQIDERKDSVGRPAHLYHFDQETYHRLLKEQTKFGF